MIHLSRKRPLGSAMTANEATELHELLADYAAHEAVRGVRAGLAQIDTSTVYETPGMAEARESITQAAIRLATAQDEYAQQIRRALQAAGR